MRLSGKPHLQMRGLLEGLCDEAAAKKKFAQYKKCTSVYWNQWTKRKDIERLTVAG